MTQQRKPLPSSASAEPFQVGPETFVTVSYEVFDEEGERVGGAGPDVHSFVFGCGALLPPLEHAIEGRLPGDHCSVELPPEDAFGCWDHKAVVEVDGADFPPGTQPGDTFEAENADGAVLVFKVLDVSSDVVLLDTNHPLAGQKARFEIEILEVRPASEEEVELAQAVALESSETETSDLLPAASLLARGDRS